MNTELPLGIRQNNPGNIRHVKEINWRGEIPSDSPYCLFADPIDGLRALAKQLWVYQNAHGCRTVADFVSKWAPPNENDTRAYIDDVCRRLTVLIPQTHAGTVIDINRRPQIDAMMIAIIWHENGMQPYSYTQISQAIDAAGEWNNDDA